VEGRQSDQSGRGIHASLKREDLGFGHVCRLVSREANERNDAERFVDPLPYCAFSDENKDVDDEQRENAQAGRDSRQERFESGRHEMSVGQSFVLCGACAGPP
jgi:hypothetical protein